MMELVTRMRDRLNGNTLKAAYFNQVKVKIKSVQSFYLPCIVMKSFVRSKGKTMEQQSALVQQSYHEKVKPPWSKLKIT